MLTRVDMLGEALAYAARGWPVFPCNHVSDHPDAKVRKEKTPLVGRDKDASGKSIENTGGLRKATTDEKQIREWWRKWPNALIGVRLGAETGLWVVDFDPRGDDTISDVADRFTDLVCDLPPGPKSETQSGGWHYWFRMPSGEIPKNSARRIKGVDWRAEGGYVILPPSAMSNGNRYSWLISPDVADFPEAPAELLDLVFRRGKFAPPRSEKAAPVAGHMPTDDRVRRYCVLALDKAAMRVRAMPDGEKNQGLNNEALGIGHLVGAGGLTMDEADSALREAAYAWGIGDDDKALKPGGTLQRALADGARSPADLRHVGLRTREARPEVPEEYAGQVDEYGVFHDDAPPNEDGAREPDDVPDVAGPKMPFRCLGYNRGTYFYISVGTMQITALKAAAHSPLNLMTLADLNQWADFLGVRGKLSSDQWMQIANSLMNSCHRAGIFSEKRVRGRGAWVDGQNVIVHTGDSARINGEIVPLTDIPGRAIYETEEPWEFEFGSAATSEEAHALVRICTRLTWMEKMSGALLAGWCVIAPVCGALKWRPHIWITGPAKSGKTTAVNEIVGRIVGPAAIRFEGNTTEAGIRQTMNFDALPIILDEAESEDQQAAIRMQGILQLARLASSGGTVAKGSTSGRAMEFVARSSFLFASINTALKHHADESRVTKLTLQRNGASDALAHYKELIRDIDATFTPEYAGAMFSRTVANLPTLLANIETFKSAAAAAFRDRRAADQIGPMLAGYYMCHSTKLISLEDAEAWIAKHDWTDHAALDSASDETRLLTHLMSKRIRMQIASNQKEMTVGQAIYETRDETIGRYYFEALAARGIKVEYDQFTISNSAPGIAELLRDTQWVNDWKRPLGQIEGAEKTPNAVYFAPGLISRGITLPISILNGT